MDALRRRLVPGARTILGITGAPGSGKSTFAAWIQQQFGPATAVVVPMDGFHLATPSSRGRRCGSGRAPSTRSTPAGTFRCSGAWRAGTKRWCTRLSSGAPWTNRWPPPSPSPPRYPWLSRRGTTCSPSRSRGKRSGHSWTRSGSWTPRRNCGFGAWRHGMPRSEWTRPPRRRGRRDRTRTTPDWSRPPGLPRTASSPGTETSPHQQGGHGWHQQYNSATI
ncbi:panthothenate kinase [Arthrobacter nitrophenolicus]|uniref:Panthothenate kinase n=1 Tax=Arthrobacter nitrophenolicus TaxID=683150 RepID=L8TJ29_9MICC|nr:panthothenate kinase [Arthrobacter nitrophenolicus]